MEINAAMNKYEHFQRLATKTYFPFKATQGTTVATESTGLSPKKTSVRWWQSMSHYTHKNNT